MQEKGRMILSLKNTFYLCSRYDKVYISFLYLVSGQEHDVVRTVDLENSAVALCNISESNNGQEKKEINNESYHFYKVGIGGAATSFSFRTLCSSKILRTHSSASVIAKLARFLKVLLPEEKQISFSPILYFTQYSSEYYIYQLRRILI